MVSCIHAQCRKWEFLKTMYSEVTFNKCVNKTNLYRTIFNISFFFIVREFLTPSLMSQRLCKHLSLLTLWLVILKNILCVSGHFELLYLSLYSLIQKDHIREIQQLEAEIVYLLTFGGKAEDEKYTLRVFALDSWPNWLLMRFVNAICFLYLRRKFFLSGKIRREFIETKTISKLMSEPHFKLLFEIFTVFYDRMAFFFRTIFTDDREIVVIVPKPVCSLASVSTRSFNFYLLRRFVGYCARNTQLLRVLNFHIYIAIRVFIYVRSFFNTTIAQILCI